MLASRSPSTCATNSTSETVVGDGYRSPTAWTALTNTIHGGVSKHGAHSSPIVTGSRYYTQMTPSLATSRSVVMAVWSASRAKIDPFSPAKWRVIASSAVGWTRVPDQRLVELDHALSNEQAHVCVSHESVAGHLQLHESMSAHLHAQVQHARCHVLVHFDLNADASRRSSCAFHNRSHRLDQPRACRDSQCTCRVETAPTQVHAFLGSPQRLHLKFDGTSGHTWPFFGSPHFALDA